MNMNLLGRKYIIMCVTLLLLASLNPILNVSAEPGPIIDENDGIWYDNFDDLSGISDNNLVEVLNGKIQLEYGSTDGIYNYAQNNNAHEAFESDLTPIYGESELFRPNNLFTEKSFDEQEYENISYKNGNVSEVISKHFNVPLIGDYLTFTAVQHFRFKIDQEYIDKIEFSWWYGPGKSDANIKNINLYVWDYSYSYIKRWVKLDSIDFNSSLDTNSIFFETDSAQTYVSTDRCIDFLVVAIPDDKNESCTLTTDYVNLAIEGKEGYLDKGYATSNEINKPNTNHKWESVIWEATWPNDITNVKIQVLDENGKLLSNDDLEDNSKGFTLSPLDLSNIPSTVTKIKLNATLSTDELAFTPILYGWGVTWQTQDDQYKDNFFSDLRIDEKNAVQIQNREIKMSDSYGDWAIFGRNSENTRSYEGQGPSKDELYWYTSKTVGGGFRSPVLSDDIVYIASPNDDKIYAFSTNVDEADQGKENSFIDSSSRDYFVDSAVAVSDELVIVPTSEINESNSIYALNKSNLKEVKWNYSASPNTICFSSAPTISKEKVFVTSWNGMLYDTPLVTSFIPIGAENNKIIALNLDDGTEIWSKELPGCSFSSPAVSEGMVFVGCDNMPGDSLFAFDQETGIKIWNTSVGYIGRASPVVYENKVFVVVKEIKNILSLTGDVQVLALDKYTGEKLWNKTLAENVIIWEDIPKTYQLYYPISTSTPAIFENTLFVSSPNGKVYAIDSEGEEKWVEDLGDKNLLSTVCNSPVATYDKIYVAASNGKIYAMDKYNGSKELFYNCRTNNANLLTNIIASPIVADGLIYVSVTDNIFALNGYLLSIGNYSKETKRARVVSTPINLPDGKWWDKFYADYTNESDSTITFSILDENYNVLIQNIQNGDNLSDPSEITTGAIRLSADFYRTDSTLNPKLKSWTVTWSGENNPPEFKNNSFVPDPGGWINTNTPVCSVIAYDSMPGLNPDSASYKITYLSDKNKEVTSEWIKASCTGILGSRTEETITADISELDFSDTIKDLKSITIAISDLAGFDTTISTLFKKDTIKPVSGIKDAGSFSNYYNEPVIISATAYDDYDANSDPDKNNVSKIDTVALYYEKDNEQWEIYESIHSPYTWEFRDMQSGDYKFCTIAVDNAGNRENKALNEEISFIYDEHEPEMPSFKSEYRSITAPELSATFKDDYELEKIEYRLGFHGLDEWITLEDNVGEKSYTATWSLDQDDWEYLDGDKEYYVYFKITDSVGNIYETKQTSDALVLVKDTTATKSYLDLSDFDEFAGDDKFVISANIFDDANINKVEVFYRYSEDETNWTEWSQYGDALYTSPFEWEFIAKEGNGFYQFKTKVKDISGNVGESPAETVEVNIFPVVPAAILIGLAITLLIITIVILIVIKKKKEL